MVKKIRKMFIILSALCVIATLQAILIIIFAKQYYATRYESRTLIFNKSEKTRPTYAKQHVVLYYNPYGFSGLRSDNITFKNCKFNNCYYTTDSRTYLSRALAVVIDPRVLQEFPKFKRPKDQVWIFKGHETQITYGHKNLWTKNPIKSGFNWTMTHRKESDIVLPHGKIVLADESKSERDWSEIMRHKQKGASWVVSDCSTTSKRMEYVRLLQLHYPIDIFGECGEVKLCGQDRSLTTLDKECFQHINKSYKFYLAFENAFCDDYVTEKFLENYDRDLILVARGLKEAYSNFPKGTFINTNDFNSAAELGKYLRFLDRNKTAYINFLKHKNKYKVIGYAELFQDAFCKVCERLNDLNSYRKQYADITKFIFGKNRCHYPTDI